MTTSIQFRRRWLRLACALACGAAFGLLNVAYIQALTGSHTASAEALLILFRVVGVAMAFVGGMFAALNFRIRSVGLGAVSLFCALSGLLVIYDAQALVARLTGIALP